MLGIPEMAIVFNSKHTRLDSSLNFGGLSSQPNLKFPSSNHLHDNSVPYMAHPDNQSFMPTRFYLDTLKQPRGSKQLAEWRKEFTRAVKSGKEEELHGVLHE
jgi:hypothetical protein